ncbi:MAG: 7-cyano-7-deazaguanine synthase QueC [Acidobacteriota bacterium]|jgi:7-cyano-7-deazaguanine synthase|nr:7-cyano-7-deazaguanine synthase QueC [Acidobacteriota bacterium]
MNKGVIVLFSGGIDSTTALYWALKKFEPVRALIFDYGQQHRIEVAMAKRIAASLGVECDVAELPLPGLLNSALLGDARPIAASLAESRCEPGPPSTYVPFRNGIFLAIAAAYAESRGCRHLVTGFNSIDAPDYPDTTEAFARKMAAAINQGTSASKGGAKFKLHTPLATLSKKEIVALGFELGADYSHSVSCYRGSEVPCGRCPSCDIRSRAFAELGRTDPLLERLGKEGKA